MDTTRRYQALLQRLNLSPESHCTCIGIAKSTKRQCGRRVALQSRNQAAQILSTVAESRLTVESIKIKMELVAKLLLCKKNHQRQSTKLSSLWTGKLRSSRFTTHTATVDAALDDNSSSQGAGQQDLVAGSSEASDLSITTTSPRARQRRAPHTPSSTVLRSVASVALSSVVLSSVFSSIVSSVVTSCLMAAFLRGIFTVHEV